QDHWDDHTQSIVVSRLIRDFKYRFLTILEAEMVRVISSMLVDDDDPAIIQYVICHIDEKLSQPIGEDERRPGVPKAADLIREGLRALEVHAVSNFLVPFTSLRPDLQHMLLTEISEDRAAPVEHWEGVPQKELFKKILNLTLEAYYSHPSVWSEIGYGGPAYPRGYVRTQMGQLDPWEAQPE
ncbi:MAG TPA: gluconate 2-dehydrogenase subunit 3 family protein, partial [Bacilli bacterium]